MQEIIGRLLITQKGYSPTSLTFVGGETIEVQVANEGKYVSVYKRPITNFWRNMRFMTDFINMNKVDEITKDWRR